MRGGNKKYEVRSTKYEVAKPGSDACVMLQPGAGCKGALQV